MGCCGSCCKPKVHNIEEPGSDNDDNDEEECVIEEEFITYTPFSDFLLQDDPTLNGYCFLNEIGCGCMSRVFQVVKVETDEIFAAKVYNNSQIGRSNLSNEDPPYVCIQRELDLMAKLSHRYLISLIDAFNDATTNSLIIIIPFAPLGNLKSMIDKKIANDDIFNACFHQISLAGAYLHSQNVVHRDIKPENFLAFAEDYFVLSDLSVSQELESPNAKLVDTKGSPAFLSPEETAGNEFDPKPADVWAFGVSMYNSYYGLFPFDIDNCIGQSMANTIMMIADHLKNKELTFPKIADKNPQLKSLLTKILTKDPTKRLTFEQISQDPFFEKSREIDRINMLNAKDDVEEEEESKLEK